MADSGVKRAPTKCEDETRCAATDRKSLASCSSTGNDRIWPHLRGHRICDSGGFHGKPARAQRSDLARGAAHGASHLSVGSGDIRLLDSGRAEPKCPNFSCRFHTLCFASICRSFGQSRFRIPAVPALSVLAAAGAVQLRARSVHCKRTDGISA